MFAQVSEKTEIAGGNHCYSMIILASCAYELDIMKPLVEPVNNKRADTVFQFQSFYQHNSKDPQGKVVVFHQKRR